MLNYTENRPLFLVCRGQRAVPCLLRVRRLNGNKSSGDHVVLDGPQDFIGALSGRIGNLKGVTAKTSYSNVKG